MYLNEEEINSSILEKIIKNITVDLTQTINKV